MGDGDRGNQAVGDWESLALPQVGVPPGTGLACGFWRRWKVLETGEKLFCAGLLVRMEAGVDLGQDDVAAAEGIASGKEALHQFDRPCDVVEEVDNRISVKKVSGHRLVAAKSPLSSFVLFVPHVMDPC
jgi:hypothetical protein